MAENNEEKSCGGEIIVSRDFRSPEADLRLHSSDKVEFHVFSRILTEASPVFRDMASLPKPEHSQTNGALSDCVDLAEDAETLDLTIRFLYPMPDPSISTLDVLKRLLKAADKYLLEGMMHSLRRILVSPIFVEKEPLRVYALACMYRYETEAKIASRHCLKTDIVHQAELYEELAMISGRDLLRLIKLHQTRATAILSILNGSGPSTCAGEPTGGGPIWWTEFKNRAREEIRVRPLSEIIFSTGFLAGCVNVGGVCPACAANYVSSATQARLVQLKGKIDTLADTV